MVRPPRMLVMEGGKHFEVYAEPGLSMIVLPAVEWFDQHPMRLKPAVEEDS